MAKDPFVEWLQSRLTAHGADIREDDEVGNETTSAIKEFQADHGLQVTGLADKATVRALRKPKPGGGPRVRSADVPKELLPPWLVEMQRRIGLHEKRNRKALSEWLRIGKFLGDPSRLPWCGDAVETCIVKTLPNEPVPSNPFFAQNWKTFGIDAGGPIVGAIGVIRWSSKAGHVGIVVGYDRRRRRVHMLGGNQQDSVKVSSFPEEKFIAFRWPKTFPIQNYAPLIAGSVNPSDFASTR